MSTICRMLGGSEKKTFASSSGSWNAILNRPCFKKVKFHRFINNYLLSINPMVIPRTHAQAHATNSVDCFSLLKWRENVSDLKNGRKHGTIDVTFRHSADFDNFFQLRVYHQLTLASWGVRTLVWLTPPQFHIIAGGAAGMISRTIRRSEL